MARQKSKPAKRTVTKSAPVQKSQSSNDLKALWIRLTSNTFNLALGIIIVASAILILSSLFKGNQPAPAISRLTNFLTGQKTVTTPPADVNSYKVRQGDNLWKIAQEKYGSGFNAYDIARANKLENPNDLKANQVLKLPTVTPKESTTGEIGGAVMTEKKPAGVTTYKVQEGDCLWNIAMKVYGNPYKWTQLAQANDIPNPDLIYAGTVLRVP